MAGSRINALRSTASGLAVLALACGMLTGLATSAGASTPGVTSNSISLGATVPLTGPAAPGYSEIAPAANAVFQYQNAHGGVFGRKITYNYLDDGYNPTTTASDTRELVLQDNIFADVGSLGTPTQLAVQSYLNGQKIPQLFIESGCNCWSNSKYPYSFGWQPPYTIEGKILGTYVKSHFAGKKIGLLYQDDEFGQDVVKGLRYELSSSSIVSSQTYDAATLAGPLTNQMAALKNAGAQVVILATIPAATALAMLPAAATGYLPQYVVDSVGADSPTVGPLLASFTTAGGGSAAEASAAKGLLNGVITDVYQPYESDVSNAWVKVAKAILAQYAPSLYAKFGLDGNTIYGVSLGLAVVQALQAAGRNLTRASLISAIESKGHSFSTPGFVPPSFSRSNHFGLEGAEVVQLSSSAPPSVTPTGSWIGSTPLTGVEVTSPGSGPVSNYRGKVSTPSAALQRNA